MAGCSRSSFGIIIGSLYIFVSIIASIYLISLLAVSERPMNDDSAEIYEISSATDVPVFVIALTLYLAGGLISGLLVMGIVKKRHLLMTPWLGVSFIYFVLSCIQFIHVLIINASQSEQVVVMFIVGCIGLGIQFLIMYPIYTLFKDIRANNKRRVKM